jgi:hypothetical protein
VVLTAPGESCERRTEDQDDLIDREHDERESGNERDDLGHANTVAGGRWAFGATAVPKVAEYWFCERER